MLAGILRRALSVLEAADNQGRFVGCRWKRERKKGSGSSCCTIQEKPPQYSGRLTISFGLEDGVTHCEENALTAGKGDRRNDKVSGVALIISLITGQGTDTGRWRANYHRQPTTHQTGSVRAAAGPPHATDLGPLSSQLRTHDYFRQETYK